MNNIIKLLTVSSIVLTGCGRFEQGKPGKDGKDGVNGKDGSSCSVVAVPINSVAPNGGSLIKCTDGSSSLILNGKNGTNGVNGSNGKDGVDGTDGVNGTNGTNGKDGTNGVNGLNGTNGTVVAPIQFCPGTTSYPSTFPEVGFCINDKIYAVYSANGGFLTVIAPGAWSSNAIGSSCSFTVAAHCVVTH